MITYKTFRSKGLAAATLSAAVLGMGVSLANPLPARAAFTETVLHTFSGTNGDGSAPSAPLLLAADGALYGTTRSGGAGGGGGIIFKSTHTGTYQILHKFGDGTVANDGASPYAPLVQGADGSFYGTTFAGGAYGYGTVYKMSQAGAVTILHSFSGNADGANPIAAITIGSDGTLYGTTSAAGSAAGDGTIFSLNINGGGYLVQFRFGSAADTTGGKQPEGTLVEEQSNSAMLPTFIGTTFYGGSVGDGTTYSFTPGTSDGAATVALLTSFGDTSSDMDNDGKNPDTGVLQYRDDVEGYIGTTENGGGYNAGDFYFVSFGYPVDYYDFGTYEAHPMGSFSLAGNGNFYGAAHGGTDTGDYKMGDIFEFSEASSYSVIYTFGSTSANDG